MTLCIPIAYPIARHPVNIQYIFREIIFLLHKGQRELDTGCRGWLLGSRWWGLSDFFLGSHHQKFPGILGKWRAKGGAFCPGTQEQRKECHLPCRTWLNRTLRARSGFKMRMPQNKIKNWWWKSVKCPFCLLCICRASIPLKHILTESLKNIPVEWELLRKKCKTKTLNE